MPSNDDSNGGTGDGDEPTLSDVSQLDSVAPDTSADDLEFVPDIPELDDEIGREIYQLADQVRALEPWGELAEDDWFGIAMPDSGEVMVVSIIGMAEENFAVQLYLQREGIYFWNEFLDDGEPEVGLMMYDLRMIECEFAPQSALDEHDLRAQKRFAPAAKKRGRSPSARSCTSRPRSSAPLTMSSTGAGGWKT